MTIKRSIIIVSTLSLAGIFLAFFVFGLGNEPVQENNVLSEATVQENNVSVHKKDIVILFGGDMMFDRYIRQVGEQKGYDYVISDMQSLFWESDCVVANLEGPITTNKSVSLNSEFGTPNNYRFTFDSAIVQTLKENNFCIVNLGNNHIRNFGAEGIYQTKEFIRVGDLHYFGDTGIQNEQRYFVQDFYGTKIAFVNYNAFGKNSLLHTQEDLESVKKEKADLIIVYAHWGNEYDVSANDREKQLAHSFIDEGADVVLGSHPHVVQESEIYKGKMIYYSLGNFVFDQYFSQETKKGLLVKMTIKKSDLSIEYEEIPIKLNTNGRTEIEK